MDFIFGTEAEASAYGKKFLESEEPGSYYRITPVQAGKFRLDFYEEDGYLINQEAPRMAFSGTVVAPRPQQHRHLG